MRKRRYKWVPLTQKELAARDEERTREWLKLHAKAGKSYEYRAICSSGFVVGRGVVHTL